METHDHPTYKLITALNKRLEPGVALNATAHMALGLSARVGAEQPGLLEQFRFLDFADRDGGSHPYISGLSLIVYRATSNELRKLREALAVSELPFVDFTATMTGDTWVEQLARSAATPAADLEYYGVCACGLRSELDPLTRRLSLWR